MSEVTPVTVRRVSPTGCQINYQPETCFGTWPRKQVECVFVPDVDYTAIELRIMAMLSVIGADVIDQTVDKLLPIVAPPQPVEDEEHERWDGMS